MAGEHYSVFRRPGGKRQLRRGGCVVEAVGGVVRGNNPPLHRATPSRRNRMARRGERSGSREGAGLVASLSGETLVDRNASAGNRDFQIRPGGKIQALPG